MNSRIFLVFTLFLLSLNLNAETDRNMQQALSLYKMEKYEDSLYFFNQVIERNTALKYEAMFWKSKSLYQIERYSEAKVLLEEYFRTGVVSSSYYEDARFLYCKVYFKMGEFRDAMLLLNQYLRNKSFGYYKTSAKFWLAESYLQLSMYNEAKKTYKEYLTLNPSSKVALGRIELIDNMLTLLTEDRDETITIYDKALWLNDYIVKEQTLGDETYVSDFLNSFSNQEEFFAWLKQFSTPITEEKDEKETTDLKLLNDLESKLLHMLEGSDE